jgi:tRNA dimethylallyltransferase
MIERTMDVVLIAGPTAAGKSAAALLLAERIRGAIINADSMQVYAELPILSGQPSAEDWARIPHRLFGHVDAAEAYSAGRFQQEAAAALAAAKSAGRIPIFAGGTGLYFNVLTHGLSPIPAVDPVIRKLVRQRFEELGREEFYAELLRKDPASAVLRPGDTQRILRAADVLESSGRPISDWQAVAGQPVLRGMVAECFVIAPDRELLNQRINRRFEAMIEHGAVDEVRRLLDLNPALPAARMLGFPELASHLRGEISLSEAVAAAQTMTRRFAKRQLTWFRRYMADWHWLSSGETSNILASITGEL